MIGDGLSSSTASGVPVKFGENLCCHRHHPFASGLPRSLLPEARPKLPALSWEEIRLALMLDVGANWAARRQPSLTAKNKPANCCYCTSISVPVRSAGFGSTTLQPHYQFGPIPVLR